MAKLTDDYIRKMIQWRNSTLPGALEALEELLELRERTRWIPVEERLPRLYDDVIVNANGNEYNGVFSGFLSDDNEWYLKDSDVESGVVNEDYVTHWMPLPSIPKVLHE